MIRRYFENKKKKQEEKKNKEFTVTEDNFDEGLNRAKKSVNNLKRIITETIELLSQPNANSKEISKEIQVIKRYITVISKLIYSLANGKFKNTKHQIKLINNLTIINQNINPNLNHLGENQAPQVNKHSLELILKGLNKINL